MPGIQQGYRGWVTLSPTSSGPIHVLCRPGARLSMPRNLDTPYPISNQAFGIINYADGLQFPVCDFPMIPMASWWTAANINTWFNTRTSDDLAGIGSGGIDFSDSSQAAGQFNVENPKGASYQISASFGEPIGFMARFMGTNVSTTLGGTIPASGLTGTPLEFNSVTFGGGITSDLITGFTLDVDNGMTPNPELNGTLRPTEMNAGIQTARLTLQTNGGVPLVDGTTGTITIGGVNFEVTYLIAQAPVDRAQVAGRVIRSFSYLVLASTSQVPVLVS